MLKTLQGVAECRTHYGCQQCNEPLEERGATSLLFVATAKPGKAPSRKAREKQKAKLLGVLIEPSVRCKTRNIVGQCFPTSAHQSRNSKFAYSQHSNP